MRILLAHNYYQQKGGEGHSFAAEVDLLRSRGHDVTCYTIHNDAIDDMSALQVARKTLWNRDVFDDLRAHIRRTAPQLIHFNNTFPLLAPSAYYAARDEGVPVVKTIRNYRPFCLNGVFFRDGHVCEDCLGTRMPWPGVRHACYRDSYLGSTGAATWTMAHRLRDTWNKGVDTFIVCSRFAEKKLLEGGFPEDQIRYKPNFLDPVPPTGDGRGKFALFVGRLSPEKGLHTLVEAWTHIGDRMPLVIVGEGPLNDVAEWAQEHVPGVAWRGWQSPPDVYDLMGQAQMLVFPSEWYETFGRVAMEAFATGTPVIVSNIGGQAERVEHNRTGRLFEAGDPADLARQVEWALDHPAAWRQMRKEARADFEKRYTAARNYEMLMDIYDATLHRRDPRRGDARNPNSSAPPHGRQPV